MRQDLAASLIAFWTASLLAAHSQVAYKVIKSQYTPGMSRMPCRTFTLFADTARRSASGGVRPSCRGNPRETATMKEQQRDLHRRIGFCTSTLIASFFVNF